MEITTIKLSKDTKSRLEHIRSYKRETYDEIIQKMLSLLNTLRANPDAARARLISLDKKKRILERENKMKEKADKRNTKSSDKNVSK